MSWQHNKAWADNYWAAIEAIIRSVAGEIISVRRSNDLEDQTRATDIVFDVSGGRIACRIRGPEYMRYNDVTIRVRTSTGAETEVDKLPEVPWYLYGWARTRTSRDLGKWVFYDIQKARTAGLFQNRHQWANRDGTYFIAVPVKELRAAGAVVRARGC